MPAGPERTLEFKGLAFVQRWAIPNVYFHITTAYNILRHNGVEIGKRDFIGASLIERLLAITARGRVRKLVLAASCVEH